MDDACVLCGAPEGGDLRTLRIGCLYDMAEIDARFTPVKARIEGVEHEQTLWTMRICKECRGDLLDVIGKWAATALAVMVDRETEEMNPERNIPVRVNGRPVMMTRPEYDAWRATNG